MRLLSIALLCAGLAACEDSGSGATDGGTDTESNGDTERPSPYAESSGETGTESPTMQPDEVVSAAVAGLAAFVALQPDAVVDEYEALAMFDETCPEEVMTFSEGASEVTSWFTEGCTTADGVQFQGGARFERFEGEEDGRTSAGASLSAEGGSFAISAPGGKSLQYSGYLSFERGTSDEGTDSYFEFNATATADADTAAASALLEGSVAASGALYSYAVGPIKVIGGAGSMSGPALGEAKAFQFSDLLLIVSECASEPAGTLSVRDDAGFWHDVVFDAAEFDPESGEDPVFDASKCDGCGTYLAGGEPLGDACITEADLSGLLNWEEYPW